MKISELKVLICDDSPLIRKKFTEILLRVGVGEVFAAEDGTTAVKLYTEKKPDVTFMDIVMPEKNGLEALTEIKALDSAAKVVIVSTTGTQQNLIKAVKAGAFEFLQKPVKEDDIMRIINSLLKS